MTSFALFELILVINASTSNETDHLLHPILQGKPNASHICVRIKLHTYDRQ
jgi:hypothetical protein